MPDVQPITKAAAARKRTIKKKRDASKADKAACDILFSLIIRKRDGRCMRCGKQGGRLECSHIIPREIIVIRCHPLNAKALCHTCHRWWHAYSSGIAWIVESGVRTAAEIEWLHEQKKVTGVKVDWHEMRKELKAQALACGAI